MKLFLLGLMGLVLASCGKDDRGEITNRELFGGTRQCTVYGQPAVFQKAGLTAVIKWLPVVPPPNKDQPFELRFFKTETGNKETGPFVKVEYLMDGTTVHWEMPDHGHGTKKPVKIEEIVNEPGTEKEEYVYKATKMQFSMLGHWDLHIDLKKEAKDKPIETAYSCHNQK